MEAAQEVRRISCLRAWTRLTECVSPCFQATDFDEDKKHTAEIESLMQKCAAALYAERSQETEEQALARAMKDPEVGVR